METEENFNEPSSYQIKQDQATNKWVRVLPLGDTLGELSGHSAHAYQQLIVIFGGTDGKVALDRLLILDSNTHDLREITKTEDQILNWPEARTSHASCINQDIMYIHGGSTLKDKITCDNLWSLNIKTMRW